LHASHPAALEGSKRYACETVDGFFKEHTQIDISYIESHNNKFNNLVVESRLEIAFAGRQKGFRVPNYKIYKCENSEGLAVVFVVETRLIRASAHERLFAAAAAGMELPVFKWK